jgi:nucleoside diphosphate kinase
MMIIKFSAYLQRCDFYGTVCDKNRHFSDMAAIAKNRVAASFPILQAVIVILLISAVGETAEPAITAGIGGSNRPAAVDCSEVASQTTGGSSSLSSSMVACTTSQQQQAQMPRCKLERVLVMLKPDAVQRGLVAAVIGRLEQKGAQLVAMKMVRADRATLEQHYLGKLAHSARMRFISARLVTLSRIPFLYLLRVPFFFFSFVLYSSWCPILICVIFKQFQDLRLRFFCFFSIPVVWPIGTLLSFGRYGLQ